MIVGICGLAGSGKDEVGKILVEKHGFVAIAIADPMKRFLMEVFDFSEDQLWGPSEERNRPDKRYVSWTANIPHMLTEEALKLHPGGQVPQYLTPRHALQQLGTEWGRSCYPDVWVEYTMRVAKLLLRDYVANEGIFEYNRRRGAYQGALRYIPGTPPLYNGVVITDLRMKNEVEGVKKAGGWVARVIRPGYDKPVYDHNTETEQTSIPDTDFNSLIINDKDLKNLEREVHILMEVLK